MDADGRQRVRDEGRGRGELLVQRLRNCSSFVV
jgi:hypothetical protein